MFKFKKPRPNMSSTSSYLDSATELLSGLAYTYWPSQMTWLAHLFPPH